MIQRRTFIQNQFGTTLIELMISIGVSSLVCLGTATLMSFAAEQFFVIMEKNITEENLLSASYVMRLHLSQAVDLSQYDCDLAIPNPQMAANGNFPRCNGIPMGATSAAPMGLVANHYDSATSPVGAGVQPNFTNNGVVDLLAVFVREDASSGPVDTDGDGVADMTGQSNPTTTGGQSSTFRSTAIFFERPNVTVSPARFGRLFFDAGATVDLLNVGPATTIEAAAPVAAIATNLVPDFQDVIIDRIVRVRSTVTMATAETDGFIRARSATITLTGRYFKSTKMEFWKWCPDTGDATTHQYNPLTSVGATNCAELPSDLTKEREASYRDIETTVVVTFRNNGLAKTSPTGGARPERIFGALYFLKPAVPAVSF